VILADFSSFSDLDYNKMLRNRFSSESRRLRSESQSATQATCRRAADAHASEPAPSILFRSVTGPWRKQVVDLALDLRDASTSASSTSIDMAN
jgi:hypothetical protein